MAALESTLQAQAAKIQKLRADKGELKSLLEFERSSLAKLEFDYKSSQAMLDTFRQQMQEFQALADISTSRPFLLGLSSSTCSRTQTDSKCFMLYSSPRYTEVP